MGGCAHADDIELGACDIGGNSEGATDGGIGWGIGNDWAAGTAAVSVEEIRWAVDLGIEVVGCAGTAKTSSTTKDGGVGHEDGGRVVVAGDGVGGDFGEGGGDRVPEFGL